MTNLRETFLPDDGCVFLRIDMSQIEDREVKMYTGQKRMIELANLTPDVYDAHRENAKVIFGKEEINKKERGLGKMAVHAAQRKMQGKTLSDRLLKLENLIIPPQRCQAMIDNYLRVNHEFGEFYFPLVEQTLIKERKLVNSWGREWWLGDWEAFEDETWRQGYSFWPQSECADLVNQRGVKEGWRWLRAEGKRSRLNAQVHDEVILSCPVEEAWEVAKWFVGNLERPRMVAGGRLVVPAEVTIGGSWAGGVEVYPLGKRDDFMDIVREVYRGCEH